MSRWSTTVNPATSKPSVYPVSRPARQCPCARCGHATCRERVRSSARTGRLRWPGPCPPLARDVRADGPHPATIARENRVVRRSPRWRYLRGAGQRHAPAVQNRSRARARLELPDLADFPGRIPRHARMPVPGREPMFPTLRMGAPCAPRPNLGLPLPPSSRPRCRDSPRRLSDRFRSAPHRRRSARTVIASGRDVLNLTVGDFDPARVPDAGGDVPRGREEPHWTPATQNYPPVQRRGRTGDARSWSFMRREFELDYPLESVVVAGVVQRPLILCHVRGLLADPGETVSLPGTRRGTTTTSSASPARARCRCPCAAKARFPTRAPSSLPPCCPRRDCCRSARRLQPDRHEHEAGSPRRPSPGWWWRRTPAGPGPASGRST